MSLLVNVRWTKLIVGEYENLISKISNYSKQFLYHIHLEAGKQFFITIENGLEHAAFLQVGDAVINDTEFTKSEFIEFDRNNEQLKSIITPKLPRTLSYFRTRKNK